MLFVTEAVGLTAGVTTTQIIWVGIYFSCTLFGTGGVCKQHGHICLTLHEYVYGMCMCIASVSVLCIASVCACELRQCCVLH